MNRLGKLIAGPTAIAVMLSLGAATIVSVTATAAHAERGGNSSGNSNRDKDRNENARGNNGHGQLSRQLRGLNAAHASQNGLMNASPNSMPGKLFIFQQAENAYQEDTGDEAAKLDRDEALIAILGDAVLSDEGEILSDSELDELEVLNEVKQLLGL